MRKKIKIPKVKVSVKMNCKTDKLFQVIRPDDIVYAVKSIFTASDIIRREQMILLLLNRANKIVGYEQVSVGGITGTVCDPRVIFNTALNCNATAIVLAHNHPSGNINPSSADIQMTQKIKDGGELLDIKLLDHIILTDVHYYSFKEQSNILD